MQERKIMYDDDTVDDMFFDGFVKDLENDPGFYVWLYGVSAKELKANPRKYFDNKSHTEPVQEKAVGVITKRKINWEGTHSGRFDSSKPNKSNTPKAVKKDIVGSLF